MVQRDTETEQEREFRKAEREDREFVNTLAELARFQPFQVYIQHLNNRIERLVQGLFEPLDDHPNAALRQEFDKGTLKGLMLARDIPSVIVTTMTQADAPSEEE